MTHTDEIFKATAELVLKKKQEQFARADVRDQLGLTSHEWDMGYTAIFQGMIEDCPEKSMKVLLKYRAVFKKISKGKYTLSAYGKSLLEGQKHLISALKN